MKVNLAAGLLLSPHMGDIYKWSVTPLLFESHINVKNNIMQF